MRRSSAASSIERRRRAPSPPARFARLDSEAAAEDEVEPAVTTTKVIDAIGARLTMKALKESPVAPAMMMFGGSPISVAVPPMFEAMISMITSGIGSMSSASASRNVIGTISRTVVRLSRNAESTAVVAARLKTHRQRAAARELAGADREPVVDAGRLGQVDHEHHSGQQPDRVEVDRLDRLLLREVADKQDDDRGPEQRDVRPVELLAGDDRQGDEEGGYRNRHLRLSGSTTCLADQASRLT